MENNGKNIITNIVETGSDISGGIAGSVIAAMIAGPAGLILGGASGPLISKAFKTIGNEIQKRYLSQREEVRIGAAYAFAINKFKINQINGKSIRRDAFFDHKEGRRAPAEEIFEGIILSVQREYEERKVKFLGNLYANICSADDIGQEHANQLIKMANNLSFRQFCLLQLLQSNKIENNLDTKLRGLTDNSIIQSDAIIEIRNLHQSGLVSIKTTFDDIDDNSSPIPYNHISITSSGSLFCEMLSLDEIEIEELTRLNATIKIKL